MLARHTSVPVFVEERTLARNSYARKGVKIKVESSGGKNYGVLTLRHRHH
jgi:hypothetical protein